MGWGRWSDDVQHNKKLRAISPAARWLYFSVTQECRRAPQLSAFAREDGAQQDGRITRKAAEAFARDQGCDPKLIRELLTDYYERPLWHREKDDYVINDYHDYDPPKSTNSTERVQRHRAKLRQSGVTVTARKEAPLMSPSPTPPSPLTPQEPLERQVAEAEASSTREERVAAVSEWWNEMTGDYASAKDVDKIAAVEVPVPALIEHLTKAAKEAARRGDPISSLAYFAKPRGMGRLRELESECRASGEQKPRRRGPHAGAHRAGELLGRYRGATAASAASAMEEAV